MEMAADCAPRINMFWYFFFLNIRIHVFLKSLHLRSIFGSSLCIVHLRKKKTKKNPGTSVA